MSEDRAGPKGSGGGMTKRGGAGLFEAALLYSTFWLRAFFPVSAAGLSPSDPAWHVATLVNLVPAGALILWVMHREDGFAAFGLDPRPRLSDAAGALAIAGLLILVGFIPEIIARLAAAGGSLPTWLDNPLLSDLGRPTAAAPLLVPLILAGSLVTGYTEELYFRVYLSRRLEEVGLRPAWRTLVSSLVFGASHGTQGVAAAVLAGSLGAVLSLRWEARRRWHEIALGHGLYDFTVLLLVIYS